MTALIRAAWASEEAAAWWPFGWLTAGLLYLPLAIVAVCFAHAVSPAKMPLALALLLLIILVAMEFFLLPIGPFAVILAVPTYALAVWAVFWTLTVLFVALPAERW